MARWQPNPSERLVLAALDLFEQRGYEKTTVIEIAERAGLTKSTFFRHFADKREVLFGGDTMAGLLAEGIETAPEGAHCTRSGGSRPRRGRKGSLHARAARIQLPTAGGDSR